MSVYTLPPDLPAPIDDGACDHLVGLAAPELTLDSSQGPVDLAELAAGRAASSAAWSRKPHDCGVQPRAPGIASHPSGTALLGWPVRG